MRARRWLAVAAAACLLILAGALAVLRSSWLAEQLRREAVRAVERGTGSRASLERLSIQWFPLAVRLEGFTLEGLRREGEQPLFSSRAITARLAVSPFSSRPVRLKEVRVEQPRVSVYHRADGTTNLPRPKAPPRHETPVADLVRLRVGLLDLRNAHFELDDRPVDFSLVLDDFTLGLAFDYRRAQYRLELAASRARLPWRLEPALRLEAWLGADEVRVTRGEARLGDSRVWFTGTVAGLRQPRVAIEYRAAVLLRDLALSPLRQGFAVSEGSARFAPGEPLRIEGSLRAEQLAWADEHVDVRRLEARGAFVWTPASLRIEPLDVQSPYLNWRGRLALENNRQLFLDGELLDSSLARLQAALRRPVTELDARVAGPVSVRLRSAPAGPQDAEVQAGVAVSPAEGAFPLEGSVNLLWRQACACAEFADSWLATRSLRASFRGVLGRRLEAGFYATSLQEVPALAAALGAGTKLEVPVSFDHGSVIGSARLEGPVEDLRISGSFTATNTVYEGIPLDRVQADVTIHSRRLEVPSFTLRQTAGRLSGSLSLGLRDWRPHAAGALRAAVQLERADIAQVLRLAKIDAGLRGAVAGTVALDGTLADPRGSLRLSVERAGWRQQELGRLSIAASLAPDGALQASMERNGTRLAAAGAWKRTGADARSGVLALDASLAGFRTADYAIFRELVLPVDATLQARARVRLRVEDGAPRLESLDGAVTAEEVRLGGTILGPLRLESRATDGALTLEAVLGARPSPLKLTATVGLSDKMPLEARAEWPAVQVALLHRLLADAKLAAPEAWPVSGAFDAELHARGDLAAPESLSGRLVIPRLELRPAPEELDRERPLPAELFLRNAGPLELDFDARAARVRQAHFTALETDIALSGSYEFDSPAPWNLEARGTANLAVLGSFYPEIIAAGSGRLRAVVRGPAAEPQVSGQMDIQKASVFLKGLPAGVEDIEGTIFFDRNRANIQKLTGTSGGGTLTISGFAGLTRGDLAFRLQAQLQNVRLRYPEGVSNTVDADLALTGSLSASILSGVVTVKHSGFIVTGDVGSMMGGVSNPLAAATQNEFLRNLQFDVRLRSAPNAVFITSYTSDLQLQADLRLRGSPAKPILLGSIYASQGEVNFFGNRYTISRGEILFYNTAAVQPQLDLDLETRVRGITVYLNVSGPLSRLNVTYRSEPPLQSSEILALLTVGRTPAATSTSVVSSDSIRSQTVMENSAGTNTLLGSALTAGINSRTERFFGASRLRIDPSNVGVDALPQARLSIEQSISRDVTITFVTNLNRAQQQVVRLEWDLSRQWSLIAIKDENGAFAVDFLYRRRFR